ncbi:hypothetical protein D3C76_1532180 [compost metagenome]
MYNADGGNEQCRDHYAKGSGLNTIFGSGLLSIKDIQRPAHSGAKRVAGAHQVNGAAGLADRYQQQ